MIPFILPFPASCFSSVQSNINLNLKQISIPDDWNNARIDRFLTKGLNIPFNASMALLRKKCILVQNDTVLSKPNQRVLSGQILKLKPKTEKVSPLGWELFLQPEKKSQFQKNLTNIQTLFENDDLIIINKPPGVSMHKSFSKHNEPINFDQSNNEINNLSVSQMLPNFHIVHRLDKPTSGALILAKNRIAAQVISKMFSLVHKPLKKWNPLNNRIQKEYLALCAGHPRKPVLQEGRITFPLQEILVPTHKGHTFRVSLISPDKNDILFDLQNRPLSSSLHLDPSIWQSFPENSVDAFDSRNFSPENYYGKRLASVTDFRIVQDSPLGRLYSISPKTGRRHQIRVHLGSLLSQRMPIIGDTIYGPGLPEHLDGLFQNHSQYPNIPLALHSHKISILYPRNPKKFLANPQVYEPWNNFKGVFSEKDNREHRDYLQMIGQQFSSSLKDFELIDITAPPPKSFVESAKALDLELDV